MPQKRKLSCDVVKLTDETDFYPAISPTRPELNQSGQVVLISGGGTGIGKAIAQSFVIAFASHVAIIGRRLEILETTAAELRGMAASSTQVLTYQGDMTNKSDLDSVFDDLASKGLGVDVLVLNAAKFPIPGSLMDHGMDELWEHMEANVRGPMLLTERFLKQKTEKKKYLINVSSAAIHQEQHPLAEGLASYVLSKSAGTHFIQLLARQIPREQLQVVTMHPGTVFTDSLQNIGISEDMVPCDKVDLPGAFAVWAATEEAAFVHNRVVWATWDVTELATSDIRAYLNEDETFLRLGVIGFDLSKRAKGY
ncbi:hypothetical protein GRF29_28g20766 [Pseudopithomyces chartarum]|uniref:Uncharacterized protein n=1 Tax=Pseudopithomyces chartarum TaxID=1892770 RepID=A0AAN6RIZ8_9PLEO|nr:hypothetical protein GRF29_28g20766 [Pseudopithomyces chartarum]